ncbi:glutamate dehydrogenase [Candidatus Nitromaritima sp. SCGC AAA799-A02]|nr:glutamate dehydrogenase [Candidatus Nitromaritima sp. SCGC AAA799-C22]KMP12376.1 glutamate dehydrogenase [Candidatus Nitromaritima sp. SCGC AAA799-A02]
MDELIQRCQGEVEFHQAVREVMQDIIPFVNQNKKYRESSLLERLTEPDRCITFRVNWEDDRGVIQTNRGYRVQFNNAIGPYKGGLRFHPTVNLSILKFLGFEQIFKNSLTTLPLGAGKGGSDFDPQGKSEREIMRFCQAFMTELSRYIGDTVDIPAGDIGVGSREIGFMYGQYKKLMNGFDGGITGKGIEFGGSLIRKEATGYGSVYFMEEMLNKVGDSVRGKVCAVSGTGNVAQYAVEKINQMGGRVVTVSDSSGFIHDPSGIDEKKLEYIMLLKNIQRGRIAEYADKFKAEYFPGKKPWSVPCDLAFPCATQNEIDEKDALELVQNGCRAVSEGANMPTSSEGLKVFHGNSILFGPGKAANAGGVAVSGMEMTQNSMHFAWDREQLDARLREIVKNIHKKCLVFGTEQGKTNYLKGANIAGFKKVADAMLAYGIN